MTTLESIVESIKYQLKPHMNDDTRLDNEFIIRMINDTRAAMIRSMYIGNDDLNAFYQDIIIPLTHTASYSFSALPSKLMENCGRKNIQRISDAAGHLGLSFHYCSYEEFAMYDHHILSNRENPIERSMMVAGDTLYIRGYYDIENMYLRAIFEYPNEVTDYDYSSSAYPIGSVNLRQLEIVTFQHIASKLGMPTDVINNGYDETKNANVPKQREQKEEQQ